MCFVPNGKGNELIEIKSYFGQYLPESEFIKAHAGAVELANRLGLADQRVHVLGELPDFWI
jgi:hypothetical protein